MHGSLKGQGEQLTISRLSKADAPIYRFRWTVVMPNLNCDRPYFGHLAETPHFKQRSRTEALVAPRRLYIKIIQTHHKAVEFHRVFEGQH